ncbi:MAG TPA: hypothetical protein HA258_00045 [Thermoplasmata archaeon]|nr:hypothetical protein [Thermoplasmata archaeon]
MKKIIVVGIILLFVGVAVAPSITLNIARASNDCNLIEVSTLACGIPGYGDTAVMLTPEHYRDLEQYLVEFTARLNQTSTRAETVLLFREAVVKLNRYGVLPCGMSVAQAQRLVTLGDYIRQVPNWIKTSLSDSLNVFCFFAAITDNVIDYNLWVVTGAFLSQFIAYDSPLILLVYLFFLVGFIKPLRLFNTLVAVQGDVPFYFTLGLKGVSAGLDDISSVIGFTGLKIMFNTHNAFYLGFALSVNAKD